MHNSVAWCSLGVQRWTEVFSGCTEVDRGVQWVYKEVFSECTEVDIGVQWVYKGGQRCSVGVQRDVQ